MTQWQGKRVVMIGAARQGVALSRYLAEQGASVTLNDRRPEEALGDAHTELKDLEITWVTGSHPLDILDEADLVCLSGGIPLDLPLVQEAVKRNIPLSNDSQIFLDSAPCPVIGITGSAGKTTTTALVGEIARQSPFRVIGVEPTDAACLAAAMAADEDREREALEWSEAVVGDLADLRGDVDATG